MEAKRELNNPYGSKLDSANLLILGMEGLRPGRVVPVSQAAVEDAGAVSAAVDQQIGAALTCAVLYAIVVELVVKHLWEQKHAQIAEYRHDVYCLFQQLEPKTQRDVLALYDKCCRAYKKAIQTGKQQHGSETVAVDMANLKEALQWNKHAMRDLKYEMTPSGRSVPTGIFWNSKHLWVLPSTFPNFAIELTRWAARHSHSETAPQERR